MRRFRNTFIGVMSLLGTTLSAQPDTMWTRTYGGSSYDYGYSVQQTEDGGYIITGYTESYSAGQADVLLIKADSVGNILWTRAFGGDSNEMGYSVDETIDHGYIITGYTDSSSHAPDILFIKVDSTGNLIWSKNLGNIVGFCVKQTTDEGYVIAGSTNDLNYRTDVLLLKIDSCGNLKWERQWGGGAWDEDLGYFVSQTLDGGFIVTGKKEGTYEEQQESSAKGFYGLWPIKTDSMGITEWVKDFEGERICGRSVIQALDGGYFVGGYISSYDVLVIKTNSLGDTLWTRTYGGTNFDCAESVQQTQEWKKV